MNGDRTNQAVTTEKTDGNAASYQPPRIITHSADDLREATQQINACTSYDPGADPP